MLNTNMKQVTRNEVDFSEIFKFAAEHYNISWNDSNDLFFHGILTYKKYNDFILEELSLDLEDGDNEYAFYPTGSVGRKTAEIIKHFMEENKVDDIRVFNG